MSLLGLRADLRTLPREAWILFLGTFINRFGSFVIPFLLLYLRGQGYSIAQSGLAVSTYGVGFFLANSVGGYVTDRFGRRNAIVFSMISGAASMLALSQARGLPAILIATTLAGFFSELYRPASSALLADLVPADKRIIGYSMYRLAINLGFAAGPAAAGFLATKSYSYLFIGDALTSLAYAVVAMFFLPNLTGGTKEKAVWGEGLRVIASDRRFLFFLIASALNSFVLMQHSSSFALHVANAGFPSSTYGLLLSLNGLIIILIEVPLTAWTQKRSSQSMMALGYGLIAIGFALTAFAYELPFLAVTIVIWTFGEMIASPIAAAFVADLAPEHLRGRYMGYVGISWSGGLILGPALGALLFARSATLLWLTCGALGMIAVLIILSLPKRR